MSLGVRSWHHRHSLGEGGRNSDLQLAARQSRSTSAIQSPKSLESLQRRLVLFSRSCPSTGTSAASAGDNVDPLAVCHLLSLFPRLCSTSATPIWILLPPRNANTLGTPSSVVSTSSRTYLRIRTVIHPLRPRNSNAACFALTGPSYCSPSVTNTRSLAVNVMSKAALSFDRPTPAAPNSVIDVAVVSDEPSLRTAVGRAMHASEPKSIVRVTRRAKSTE